MPRSISYDEALSQNHHRRAQSQPFSGETRDSFDEFTSTVIDDLCHGDNVSELTDDMLGVGCCPWVRNLDTGEVIAIDEDVEHYMQSSSILSVSDMKSTRVTAAQLYG
jgi:hypothetical protein